MPSQPPDGLPAPADGSLPAAALAGLAERRLSLYLHVPFCATRCGYCDFNTYTAAELGAGPGAGQDAYLAAAEAELELAVRVLGCPPPLQTIFFGGGTPTMLPAAALAGLLTSARSRFAVAPDAEITTEANPESVDREYLDRLVAAGFNRLSLGMQSARPGVLAVLERRHTPGRVRQVVEWARAAGFASVSVDLIYGSPTETIDDWRTSLEAALSFAPDHVSAYSLIVEPGTRLAAQIGRGQVPAPDEDLQADCYLLAEELLTAQGFSAYEVSNWAQPGHASRHNLAYWVGDDWWGIGPGAHSHVGGVRWWNVRHPRDYSARLAAGSSPAQARELLTDEQRRVERVLLELRLSQGLPVSVLTSSEAGRVPGMLASGLVRLEAGNLRPTLRGRLLADAVIRDLLD
ncbi:MAG TPA: radical SAM family heme chaperone HemW [Propionicimonas sp.]|nr:radical SAM family heme chaperone HemW [Propionicimonas sp.]HQD96012.1 radical SAM family heme chaperone HemW [Propionicimonas sp.]